MRIDPTIYAAIDDGMLTPEQLLALTPWEDLERALLDQVAADAIADGWAEADVRSVIEKCAEVLRRKRAGHVEVMRLMLEARATSVQ